MVSSFTSRPVPKECLAIAAPPGGHCTLGITTCTGGSFCSTGFCVCQAGQIVENQMCVFGSGGKDGL